MKYLKIYEKFCSLDPIFKNGDYVVFKEDEINGYPVDNLSKWVFIIDGIDRNFSDSYLLYKLKHLNGNHFNWCKDKDIRPANDLELDAIKYNL